MNEIQTIQNNMQANSGEIIIYQPDETVSLEVRMGEDTVWLTLDQMAALFQRNKSTISRHIKSIFETNELTESSVVAKNATTASDGKTYQVTLYNLDMIISVGYRVNSYRGTKFRQWANKVLKDKE